MTNSIRPVVAASLLANGEAQVTSSGTLPSGWDGQPADPDGEFGCESKSGIRSDEGWLETERSEDSTHEAMRPAGRQTKARQESEEPYEL
jgi:hypothetical protein